MKQKVPYIVDDDDHASMVRPREIFNFTFCFIRLSSDTMFVTLSMTATHNSQDNCVQTFPFRVIVDYTESTGPLMNVSVRLGNVGGSKIYNSKSQNNGNIFQQKSQLNWLNEQEKVHIITRVFVAAEYEQRKVKYSLFTWAVLLNCFFGHHLFISLILFLSPVLSLFARHVDWIWNSEIWDWISEIVNKTLM